MLDGDYGKLVCTVFRLVLTAAVNLSEVREGMLEATAEIPETIATIDFYREVYANLGRLQQRVSRFHVATLLALEHIVCWLMKKPLSKVFRAIGSQDAYLVESMMKLANLKTSVEKLKEQAMICLHEMIIDTNDHARKGRLELAQGMVYMQHEVTDARGDILAVREGMTDGVKEMKNQVRLVEERITDGVEAMTNQIQLVGREMSHGMEDMKDHVQRELKYARGDVLAVQEGMKHNMEEMSDRVQLVGHGMNHGMEEMEHRLNAKLESYASLIMEHISSNSNARAREVDVRREKVTGTLKADEALDEHRAFPSRHRDGGRFVPGVRRQTIVALLNDPPFARWAQTALHQAIGSISRLPLGEQDRVNAIISSSNVKTYLGDGQSTALLIQGNTGRHDIIASTSFFAATVITGLFKTSYARTALLLRSTSQHRRPQVFPIHRSRRDAARPPGTTPRRLPP